MKYLSIIAILLLSLNAKASYKAYNTQTGEILNLSEFIEELPDNGHLVMGELHYTEAIQRAQGDIIRDVNLIKNLDGNFNVGMEFLNHPDQKNIDAAMKEYTAFGGSFDTLIKNEVFSSMGPENLRPGYKPIFEALKMWGGELVALNAPRPWRREVRTKGYDKIPSEYQIPNFYIGSDGYLELFTEALGGHGDPDFIAGYFAAQCYVDSVMAYKAIENYNGNYQFIIAGEFHTNYGFGTVERLKKLTDQDIVSLQIRDTSELTEEEVSELLTAHPKFGFTADYIILAE